MREHEVDLSCAKWRKSSHSIGDGACIEIASVPEWRKSSHSASTDGCVEVAPGGRVLAVRDSKGPGGPSLAFAPEQWRAFTARVASGTFSPR